MQVTMQMSDAERYQRVSLALANMTAERDAALERLGQLLLEKRGAEQEQATAEGASVPETVERPVRLPRAKRSDNVTDIEDHRPTAGEAATDEGPPPAA